MLDNPLDPGSPGIDVSVPHSARIWNYWLGGTDNFPVDQAAGQAWLATQPDKALTARATRAFLGRTISYLAGEVGIRQFLDVGSGLPTADNTHQVAQRIAPDARVVYVDHDPLVLAHARALLAGTAAETTSYVDADMHDSAAVLTAASRILDLQQPVVVLLLGVLGHVAELEKARDVIARLLAPLASDSHLVVCDGALPTDPAARQRLEEAEQAYARTGAVPYRTRSADDIAALFTGLEIVEPGIVPVPLWRPEPGTAPPGPHPFDLGGVARKR